MRLRRPAIAATTLGLAGALLPATGAAAAEPNRHVVVTEDVTYESSSGGPHHCRVVARLDWILGADGAQDNTLSATTEIGGTPGYDDCPTGEPSFLIAGVTLRWTNQDFRRFQTYTYTGEGSVEVTVSGHATPYNFYGDGIGVEADSVRSEHRASFADCVSNCEWSRTLTFNSK